MISDVRAKKVIGTDWRFSLSSWQASLSYADKSKGLEVSTRGSLDFQAR